MAGKDVGSLPGTELPPEAVVCETGSEAVLWEMPVAPYLGGHGREVGADGLSGIVLEWTISCLGLSTRRCHRSRLLPVNSCAM